MEKKILTKTETVVAATQPKEPKITVFINLSDEAEITPERQRAIDELREIFAEMVEDK